jgi:hypothetical protein
MLSPEVGIVQYLQITHAEIPLCTVLAFEYDYALAYDELEPKPNCKIGSINHHFGLGVQHFCQMPA